MQSWVMARALAGVGALALVGLGATSALAQDTAIPRAHGYAEIEKLPDWSGVWAPGGGVGGFRGPPAQPKLAPAAQQQLDAFREKQRVEGVSQDAQVHCRPPGMPGIMRQPYPLEFIFSPNRVTIFTETYSQARRIYTDGRPLPEDPEAYFNGNSVGHWEGDTLVVDTVGFSPWAEYIAGVSHGENMQIHEKFWLETPDLMRVETTITDPGVLLEPLVSQATFRKEKDWEIREYVCEENNRLTSDTGGANIDLGLEANGEGDPFGPPPE